MGQAVELVNTGSNPRHNYPVFSALCGQEWAAEVSGPPAHSPIHSLMGRLVEIPALEDNAMGSPPTDLEDEHIARASRNARGNEAVAVLRGIRFKPYGVPLLGLGRGG